MKGHLDEALIDKLAEAGEEAVEESGVTEHLASCALCREELELARMVMTGLNDVPRLEAPPELLQSVMAGVEKKATSQRRQGVILGTLAILMTIVTAVLWLFSGGAASLVIEALETVRSLEMLTRITTSVWRTIPVELFTLCTIILVASSAVLSRLVRRARQGADAAVEAG